MKRPTNCKRCGDDLASLEFREATSPCGCTFPYCLPCASDATPDWLSFAKWVESLAELHRRTKPSAPYDGKFGPCPKHWTELLPEVVDAEASLNDWKIEACNECGQEFESSGSAAYACTVCGKPMCAKCEVFTHLAPAPDPIPARSHTSHDWAHRKCWSAPRSVGGE